MSNRYAPLPNPQSDPHSHDIDGEMQAAFDYSEDEEEDQANSESRPLNPTSTSPSYSRLPQTTTQPPGTYDFENVDYDYPPPGSPPRPSTVALPNEHGNTNGLIPTFDGTNRPFPRQRWIQRTAFRLLPQTLVERLRLRPSRPSGPIGGGTHNDGVFANVTAKPSALVHIQEGDDIYVVPEDTRSEAPPSYAVAQADAVPPYWDTTVHAPFSPDSMGEMIVDSLPTGSLFSFLWNMLVSISFQFVGFLLTYLLHTTHAARLGSRAGLGITLIQYGFALRSRMDVNDGEQATWGSWKLRPTPSSSTEGNSYYPKYNVSEASSAGAPPASNLSEEQMGSIVADATTEWLSFFLMTIGWFILLTSILSFWRVKRWERGVLASQREMPMTSRDARPNSAVVSQLERAFGLGGISRRDLFRQGFGFGRSAQESEQAESASRVEEGFGRRPDGASETESILPPSSATPDTSRRERLIVQVMAREVRLREDLRAAGLV
ncbi:hypothetical protein AX17_000980 [Amanita inopinata Kibby_2008]|nr:hypothetical protein AX17_000980 [Amanita inopinata Kibby_2008]